MTAIVVARDEFIQFFKERVDDKVQGAHSVEEFANGLSNGTLDDNANIIILDYSACLDHRYDNADGYPHSDRGDGGIIHIVASLAPQACIEIIAEDHEFSRLQHDIPVWVGKHPDSMSDAPFYHMSVQSPIESLQLDFSDWSEWNRGINELSLEGNDDAAWRDANFTEDTDHSNEEDNHGFVICCTSSKGGGGKCDNPYTYIYDAETGQTRLISDIVEDHKTIKTVSYNEDGHPVISRISHYHQNSTRYTYKLTFKSGRFVEVTEDHPMLTPTGYKPALAMNIGETGAVAVTTPEPLRPVRINPDELDWLSVMLAEGTCSHNPVSYVSMDQGIIDIINKACQNLGFNIVPFRKQTAKQAQIQYNHYRINGHTPQGETSHQILLRYGAAKKSVDKSVPQQIFMAPNDQVARFIQLFWQCDGTVSKNGIPELVLGSKKMLEDIQFLLTRFSIRSTLRHKPSTCQTGTFDAWRLTPLVQDISRFYEAFPLWGQHAERIEARLNNGKKPNPNTGSPTLSPELFRKILECADPERKEPVSYLRAGKAPWVKDVVRLAGWNPQNIVNLKMFLGSASKGKMSMTAFKALCEYSTTVKEKLGWIASEDIYWDELVSVEKGDEPVPTYDLEIPHYHNFVANGIIVHNSTTAILLASQLAKSSQKAFELGQSERPAKVAIVDMDVYNGQLGFAINQLSPTMTNMITETASRDQLFTNANVVQYAAKNERLGIDCYLAPNVPTAADIVPAEFYSNLIKALRRVYDAVILDTSVNYLIDNRLRDVAYPESDAIIFVTTLASRSIYGMTRWMDLVTAPKETGGFFGIPPEKIGIVVNRGNNSAGADKSVLMKATKHPDKVAWLGVLPDMPAAITDKAENYDGLDTLLYLGEDTFNFGNAVYSIAEKIANGIPLAPLVGVTTKKAPTPKPTPQPQEVPQQKKRKKFLGIF